MENNLKPRQREILKLLATATMPVEINILTERFEKSERTIRYDIDGIKQVCAAYDVEIRYKAKHGFYIPAEQKGKCALILAKDQQATGYSPGEADRQKDFFFYFFVKKRNTGAEQIAGDFYVSRSTLSRMIARFNEQFESEQVYLRPYKTGGYELAGDEMAIRAVATRYLAECFKGSYTAEDWYLLLPDALKQSISLQSIAAISESIKRMNARYNVWITNTAFINLIAYCVIRHIRARVDRSGRPLHGEPEGYAGQLLRELVGQSTPSDRELEYLERVLKENKIVASSCTVNETRLRQCVEAMLQMLDEEGAQYGQSFERDSLRADLYEHLKNALGLFLSKAAWEDENFVVIEEVTNAYPEFYKLACRCGEILNSAFQIRFTSTELCYIAVYLFKNRKEKSRMKKNVLLVCATGKGLSHLLSIRVENVFPTIRVVGQRSPFQLSNMHAEEDIDFVISTIPLHIPNVPVVKISRILSNDDIKRIQEFLDYGKLVDEIPLREQSSASFNAKADPFALKREDVPDVAFNSMIASATIISKLILTLLEYTSKFPQEYQLEKDALLGLIIHMSMAIPRWFQATGQENENDQREYERIAEKHGVVYEIMEKFFELVENSLNVTIVAKERIAFFLYIILKEEISDESHDD